MRRACHGTRARGKLTSLLVHFSKRAESLSEGRAGQIRLDTLVHQEPTTISSDF